MTALSLYRLAAGALEPLAPALLRRRADRGKEDPARLAERLGRASAPRPEGPLAWLHGASVGESLSVLPLIEALRARRPDLRFLVTSGTLASAELLARRLPADVVHQFVPIDAPAAARRFIAHWKPDLAVFVESELWPNLILEARRSGAGLALLSARLSAASLSGWARAPAAARKLLSAFCVVMAQDDAAAEGLVRLGARDDGRLNLKTAPQAAPVDEAELARVRAAAQGRPVLLAASTHAGEEAIVLDAFAGLSDRALLVLAPRHPARGEAVAALVEARGLPFTRDNAGQPFEGRPVHIADRMGEFGLWLRAAGAVLVAGSLVPDIGGHNPLEPARLGAPMVAGPHVANWTGVYADLAGAFIPARDAAELAAAFAAVLDDPAAARAMAGRAAAVAARGEGVADTAADKLVALLP